MISELSPGDKLSLKGKIFELRKRLHEVDVEQQRAEEYSFRPQLAEYEYNDRGLDFYQSVERAELMRKQKLQLLKATLVEEDRGKCTFRPAITNYKSSSNENALPVHLRLQEKGKEYQHRHRQRIEKEKHFDDQGNRLFQPRIPKHFAEEELNRTGNSVSADEYLYRDARNREIRMQQRVVEAQSELLSDVNAKKLNSKSVQLLKKKAEREIRSVFEFLDTSNQGEISFQDLRSGMDILLEKGLISRPGMLKLTDKVWFLLDTGGKIEFSTFMGTCLSAKLGSSKQSSLSSQDASVLKKFINDFLTLATEAEKSHGNYQPGQDQSNSSFHPEISERSKKLAGQKASKEVLTEKSTSFDKLLARGKEVIRRREQLREDLLRQELAECTFHPRRVTEKYAGQAGNIIDTTTSDVYVNKEDSTEESDEESDPDVSKRSTAPESAFDRLYKLKDKPVPEKHPPTTITELQACTFKPVIDRSTLNLPVASHTSGELKSIEKSVSRMQKARVMRKTEQDRLENMGMVDEEKYSKSRDLLAAGPVPFNFRLEERRRMKELRKEQTKKARLYVDVKLGPNRTVNIAIADGDDPATVAEQFCRIYALDAMACDILTQVVRENMMANRIEMHEKLSDNDIEYHHEDSLPANNSGVSASPVTDSDHVPQRRPTRRKTIVRSEEDLQDPDESLRTIGNDLDDSFDGVGEDTSYDPAGRFESEFHQDPEYISSEIHS